eukprot:349704-Chlamydomonas_euryale.AAC.6
MEGRVGGGLMAAHARGRWRGVVRLSFVHSNRREQRCERACQLRSLRPVGRRGAHLAGARYAR